MRSSVNTERVVILWHVPLRDSTSTQLNSTQPSSCGPTCQQAIQTRCRIRKKLPSLGEVPRSRYAAAHLTETLETAQGLARSLALQNTPSRYGSTPATTKPVAKKEKDPDEKVTLLKERLNKGQRLSDSELATLELAAVARWTQLEREDTDLLEKKRQEDAERERQRDKKLQMEVESLRQAAAADRAHLEKAGNSVANELRELRELRDAALRDRASLEEACRGHPRRGARRALFRLVSR